MIKIGLEIHCQLTSLESKIFCACRAEYRAFGPNENTCPVCMGLPGALPRLNRGAVESAAMIAMALNCDIPNRIAFFRKNYFYPDLPKNYQITQLDIYGPVSIGGGGALSVGEKSVRIRRIQLEEDPGRLIYEGTTKDKRTLVDYNRAGTPLVEIVTEPDFEGPAQVRRFVRMLSDTIVNLGVADPSLDGAMRVDGNVSVDGNPRVEIKNIGSFHDLEKALRYEITRQEALVSRGIPFESETRHWDEARRITTPSRKKEGDPDYRYFLEGDIPWVSMAPGTLARLKEMMPESIEARQKRYVNYGITPQVADVLVSEKRYYEMFEEARDAENAKDLANMITTDIMGQEESDGAGAQVRIEPAQLSSLVSAMRSGKLSRAHAKSALSEMISSGDALDDVVRRLNLGNDTDESDLRRIAGEVISENPDAAREAASNPQAIHYLVGKVMKKTSGRADPGTTIRLLEEMIKS